MFKTIFVVTVLWANGNMQTWPAYFEDRDLCEYARKAIHMPKERVWDGCVEMKIPDLSGEHT